MFKDPNILIVKLEAHLMHVKAIVDGDSLRSLLLYKRLNAVDDEVKLMLALIQGAKES